MPDVATSLIESILHPPLGSLTPHMDSAGPRTGNVTLTTWSSSLGPIYTPQPINETFGVIVIPVTIPATWGFTLGYQDPLYNSPGDVYQNRFAQICVQHQLRMSTDVITATGPWLTTQQVDVHSFPLLILWDIALPGRLGIRTAPGIEIDLYYLLILDS